MNASLAGAASASGLVDGRVVSSELNLRLVNSPEHGSTAQSPRGFGSPCAVSFRTVEEDGRVFTPLHAAHQHCPTKKKRFARPGTRRVKRDPARPIRRVGQRSGEKKTSDKNLKRHVSPSPGRRTCSSFFPVHISSSWTFLASPASSPYAIEQRKRTKKMHAVALDMLMDADDDGKYAVRAQGNRFGRVIPNVTNVVTKRYTSSTSLPLLDSSVRTTSSLESLGSSSSSSHNDGEDRRPEEVAASSQKRRSSSSGLTGLSRHLLGSLLFALASVVFCGVLQSTKGRILGDFTAPLVTVSPAEDETFADSTVSPLSYTEVRKTWNRTDELKKGLEGK